MRKQAPLKDQIKHALKCAGYVMLFILIINILNGCATNTGADFCDIYAPIYGIPASPEPDAIDYNNAAYEELCL